MLKNVWNNGENRWRRWFKEFLCKINGSFIPSSFWILAIFIRFHAQKYQTQSKYRILCAFFEVKYRRSKQSQKEMDFAFFFQVQAKLRCTAFQSKHTLYMPSSLDAYLGRLVISLPKNLFIEIRLLLMMLASLDYGRLFPFSFWLF